MRELMRPTLFLVARLGLFLSVVAWGVGVVFAPGHNYSTPSYTLSVSIGSSAWYFNFAALPAGSLSWRVLRFPGIVIAWDSGTDLAIRHWLVVTIFTLLYGLLKWVYRKRGKGLVADE